MSTMIRHKRPKPCLECGRRVKYRSRRYLMCINCNSAHEAAVLARQAQIDASKRKSTGDGS